MRGENEQRRSCMGVDIGVGGTGAAGGPTAPPTLARLMQLRREPKKKAEAGLSSVSELT